MGGSSILSLESLVRDQGSGIRDQGLGAGGWGLGIGRSGFAIATTPCMSKNNNVNPGQYKVAGRERQGEEIDPKQEKAALKRQDAGKAAHDKTKAKG